MIIKNIVSIKSVCLASTVVVSLILLSGCETMGGLQSRGGQAGVLGGYNDIASGFGSRLSPATVQELDRYLAGSMTMKRDIEAKARELKIRQAANPDASAISQRKYRTATMALDALGDNVKRDFIESRGRTSISTENAAESFAAAGDDFRDHYAQVNGGLQEKSVILVVLGTLQQLWSAWSSYNEAQRVAFYSAVDQRLKSVSWEGL